MNETETSELNKESRTALNPCVDTKKRAVHHWRKASIEECTSHLAAMLCGEDHRGRDLIVACERERFRSEDRGRDPQGEVVDGGSLFMNHFCGGVQRKVALRVLGRLEKTLLPVGEVGFGVEG